MQLHPDRGGSTEAMQELNSEFEIAFALAQRLLFTEKGDNSTETAGNYRRQFYTANGWQGERYDRSLSIKDIAKLIREYVKNAHPAYRFSITSNRYHINVALPITR